MSVTVPTPHWKCKTEEITVINAFPKTWRVSGSAKVSETPFGFFRFPVVVVVLWSDELEETLSWIWWAWSARRSASWAEEIMETRRVSRVLTADVLTRNNNLEKSWGPEGTVKLYVLCLYHFQRKPIKEFFSSTWKPQICFTSFWLSHEPCFSSCVHAYLCILFKCVIIKRTQWTAVSSQLQTQSHPQTWCWCG